MELFGETASQQVLRNERVCILSQHALTARLTIHAVDGMGEVALALDTIDPPSAGQAKQDSRTIKILDRDGTPHLYGRMQFMIAATPDGGTRYTAVLPRDFLEFFAAPQASQLLVESDLDKTISVRIREGHAEAAALLEKCSAGL